MRKNNPVSIILASVLTASLLMMSCGKPASFTPSEPDPAPDPINSETEPSPEAIAALWENCEAVDQTAQLYRLLNKDLTGQPYDHSAILGNQILLVQQTFTSESGEEMNHEPPVIIPGAAGTPAPSAIVFPSAPPEVPAEGTIEAQTTGESDSIPDDAEDWNPEWDEYFNIQYRFDLYDPCEDTLTASLDVSDLNLDYYQVLDQKYLVLGSYYDNTLYIYDQNLQLVNQIENQDYFDHCTKEFAPSGEEGYYYCQCYTDSKLWKIHLEDFTYEIMDAPLYGMHFLSECGMSIDSPGTLVTGIDPVSLQRQIAVMDSNGSLKFAEGVHETPWVTGAVTADHLIYQTESNCGIWKVHSFSGSDCYFALSGICQVLALDDKHLLLQAVTYPENSLTGMMRILSYEIGKGITASISLEMGEEEYFAQGLTYLPQTNTVFLPHILTDGNTEILVWKLDDATNQLNASINTYASIEEAHSAIIAGTANSLDSARTPEELSDGFIFTQIEDPDSYDWGSLAYAYEKSCQLEKQYGVNVYIGAEMPPRVDIYNCDVQTDSSQTEWALEELAKYMSFYPDNLFRQLRYGDITDVDIYISGHQYGDGDSNYVNEPGAFVTTIDNHLMMVLNSEYIESWDYTFNHELSHMIDRRLDFLSYYRNGLFSEEKWASYNPEDFSYLNGYADYQFSEGYQKYPEYFCDDYGTTLPTEDRAEILGHAMTYYISGYDWSGYFDDGSPIKDKLAYYAACIRDGFDTTDWPETTPWEDVAGR